MRTLRFQEVAIYQNPEGITNKAFSDLSAFQRVLTVRRQSTMLCDCVYTHIHENIDLSICLCLHIIKYFLLTAAAAAAATAAAAAAAAAAEAAATAAAVAATTRDQDWGASGFRRH